MLLFVCIQNSVRKKAHVMGASCSEVVPQTVHSTSCLVDKIGRTEFENSIIYLASMAGNISESFEITRPSWGTRDYFRSKRIQFILFHIVLRR